MTNEELEAIAARCEAVRGLWHRHGLFIHTEYRDPATRQVIRHHFIAEISDRLGEESDLTADLIVNVKGDIPALLAHIATQAARIAELENSLRGALMLSRELAKEAEQFCPDHEHEAFHKQQVADLEHDLALAQAGHANAH